MNEQERQLYEIELLSRLRQTSEEKLLIIKKYVDYVLMDNWLKENR